MPKHLLDETAEFRMPRLPRHGAPATDEFEITQRMEPVLQSQRSVPAPHADARAR